MGPDTAARGDSLSLSLRARPVRIAPAKTSCSELVVRTVLFHLTVATPLTGVVANSLIRPRPQASGRGERPHGDRIGLRRFPACGNLWK